MPVDLLLPDLLHPGLEARMPALERWIARGTASTRPHGDAQSLLAQAFALPSPPPVALVSLAARGPAPEGEWIFADPVHLEVRQDAVALHDAGTLGLTAEEARALAATLGGHFAQDGLELRVESPERWYARVPAGESPVAVPLAEARGRNLFGLLPRGAGRINWASALTEAQMLLAAHSVNIEREANGRPAVNGVWFWGAGARPVTVAKPYARIHSSDDFARGLAALASVRSLPEPRGWSEVEAPAGGETVLVHLVQAVEPVRRGDREAHARALAELDERWFAPLRDALARFGTVNLLLPRARDTLSVALAARDRWKLFARARPLADHA